MAKRAVALVAKRAVALVAKRAVALVAKEKGVLHEHFHFFKQEIIQMVNNFKSIKALLIENLKTGNFRHTQRNNIDVKNLLATGEITVKDLIAIVRKTKGCDHLTIPHYYLPDTTIHVIKCGDWYIKFYFKNTSSSASTVLISVHL